MGQPPHRGDFLNALRSSIDGELPNFSDDIPEMLKNICYKAMAKNIDHRYQTVKNFSSEIQNFLKYKESIIIAKKAEAFYKQYEEIIHTKHWDIFGIMPRKLQLYSCISKSSILYKQAWDLWNDNKKAIEGLQKTQLENMKITLGKEMWFIKLLFFTILLLILVIIFK